MMSHYFSRAKQGNNIGKQYFVWLSLKSNDLSQQLGIQVT